MPSWYNGYGVRREIGRPDFNPRWWHVEQILFRGVKHISIGKCASSLLLKQSTIVAYHGVVVRASAHESGGSGSNPGRRISFFRRISAVRYTL